MISMGQAKMIDLRPCPFCGKVKYLILIEEEYFSETQYQIVCDASGWKGGCGASCGWQDTMQKAQEAWNRRANEEASENDD